MVFSIGTVPLVVKSAMPDAEAALPSFVYQIPAPDPACMVTFWWEPNTEAKLPPEGVRVGAGVTSV
jgi:hypothetical protein